MAESPCGERDLIALVLALGAADTGGPLSPAEAAIAREAHGQPAPSRRLVGDIRRRIRAGEDPLGELFYTLRDGATRRDQGAVYTPEGIVAAMLTWTLAHDPDRIVDPGAGSGRFALAARRAGFGGELIAIDLDPLAALMTRAGLACLGDTHARVICGDYTRAEPEAHPGRTAFIGNPPYVRHHRLDPATKERGRAVAHALGHRMSGLSGLHAHFFVATARLARRGDVGCFVTSSEWLDVNYGGIVRSLLADGLGGESIHVIAAEHAPFEGTMTTAAITCFRVGSAGAMRFRQVSRSSHIGDLSRGGRRVSRARLAATPRWSEFARSPVRAPEGWVPLGEICRVHRGAVTGANAVWVVHAGDTDLPESVLFPAVTRARELFEAGEAITDPARLRLVIDLPADLNQLAIGERRAVERFLRRASRAGVPDGYIAAHRRPWWAVGLPNPAPILATYMARRPPAFVLNRAGARHINVAHGLYPRIELGDEGLAALARALGEVTRTDQGRTYAGGLTKFEPREMERIMVPGPDLLRAA